MLWVLREAANAVSHPVSHPVSNPVAHPGAHPGARRAAHAHAGAHRASLNWTLLTGPAIIVDVCDVALFSNSKLDDIFAIMCFCFIFFSPADTPIKSLPTILQSQRLNFLSFARTICSSVFITGVEMAENNAKFSPEDI